jgi:hypothetical protein
VSLPLERVRGLAREPDEVGALVSRGRRPRACVDDAERAYVGAIDQGQRRSDIISDVRIADDRRQISETTVEESVAHLKRLVAIESVGAKAVFSRQAAEIETGARLYPHRGVMDKREERYRRCERGSRLFNAAFEARLGWSFRDAEPFDGARASTFPQHRPEHDSLLRSSIAAHAMYEEALEIVAEASMEITRQQPREALAPAYRIKGASMWRAFHAAAVNRR